LATGKGPSSRKSQLISTPFLLKTGWAIQSSQPNAREYSFPGAKELAKRLGVSETEFHKTVKPAMKTDFWREMKKIGTTNPDIGIDLAGNIVLKHPITGKVVETGVPLTSYGR
jgi:hypothetical protein